MSRFGGSEAGAGPGPAVGAILLAAGESTRMGELKALLDWEGRSLLDYQVEQLLASPVQRLVVVLGHRAAELRGRLPVACRLTVVENAEYAAGKVSSIRAGLAALPAGDHVLILGVDQPRPAGLLRAAIDGHLQGGSITIAGYQGRRGHPVLFAPELREELLAIEEASQGLRAVLGRHAAEVRLVETGSLLALVNLNAPADYLAARRLLAAGG